MLNVLQRFLTGDVSPNKVQEIKSDQCSGGIIMLRDGAMVLYGPGENMDSRKYPYEIVLHRPFTESSATMNTSFSLFRATTITDSEERFNAYTQRLPFFVEIVKDMLNLQGLQKICDILTINPSWTLAHLVAHFNLPEHVRNPRVVSALNDPDYATNMTPFQLAVKAGSIEMIKALFPLVKVDILDNCSNSVFHYAATTNKDIINLLLTKSNANLNHCNSDGYTPLHLACLADKPECVKHLLLAGADGNISAQTTTANKINRVGDGSVADFLQRNPNTLDTQDMKFGGSPLHWSCSREVLDELIERDCDVNSVNFNGQTPLHIMVNRNRLECVVALLSHSADIDARDNEGNTPLHLAVEKKFVSIVQALVVFGCNINIKNQTEKTPRHIVGKEASGTNDDMILYILHSVGAKRCPPTLAKCPPGCNATGTYNGIPPAQPETSEKREHIQQVLSSSNRTSRTSLLNNISNLAHSQMQDKGSLIDTTQEKKGASIMDSILGMFIKKDDKKGETSVVSIDDDEEMLQIWDTAKEENLEQKTMKGGRLLCLDGGGIRGLILAQLLLEIETLSQTPINHLFDWIAGTSTGGILALGLGVGKNMREILCLYLRMKNVTFTGSRPYPSEPLEALLRDNLGETTLMSDIVHPKLMITALMADRKPVDLHIFRNYKCASDILGIVTPANNRRVPPPPPEEQLVWRAARATGAAPSYFRSYGRYLDGGLIANNPTLDAMTEIHEYNMVLKSVGREAEAHPPSIVVSLGTGLIPVTEMKEIDIFRPENIWDIFKCATGLNTISQLLVDQATSSDGRVVDRARAWCSMINIPYYRFNPQMSEDIAMDEKKDEPLINMLWETKAYLYANRNKIMEMINLLK